jgi:hypothetical protein
LVAVFWQLSGMAITNDLPSVFCWVSQMASSHISSFISWDEMCIFRGSLNGEPRNQRCAIHSGELPDNANQWHN